MSIQAPVKHPRYDDLTEFRDWLTTFSDYVGNAVSSFSQFGLAETRCYSAERDGITARSFYLSKALSEVYESSLAMRRLALALPELSSEDPSDPLKFRSIRMVHYKEQLSVNRRLFELFVELANFAATDIDYEYAHFLLLNELEQLQFQNRDEQTFYSRSKRSFENRIVNLLDKINALEVQHAGLLSAWYLHQQAATNSKRYSKGKIFISYRERLLRLDGKISDFEKLATGATYAALYSNASKYVHFTATDASSSSFPEATELCLDATFYALLNLAILGKLQFLNGVGISNLDRDLIQMRAQLQPTLNRFYAKFDIGDFIVVADGLARVTKVFKGAFDYLSYGVEFVEDAPAEPEHAYPAFEAHHLPSLSLVALHLYSKVDGAATEIQNVFDELVSESLSIDLRIQAAKACWRLVKPYMVNRSKRL